MKTHSTPQADAWGAFGQSRAALARAVVLVILLSGAASIGTAAELARIDDQAIEPGACLTDAQRAEIRATIEANIRSLRAQGKLPEHPVAPMAVGTFGWPLRLKAGLDDPGYHGISNFVDHDASVGAWQDYNCGTRSYDGHLGTDFYLTPFSWLKMDRGYVEIVAVEAGTIIYEHDGEYDRNCTNPDVFWNAVYVQSADGTTVGYGHMKNGSLTTKLVGDAVAKGEYLGLVGSSGNSSGPHLHLEVHDSGNNLIDPYAGSCNPTIGASWWESQRGYYDSAINLLLTLDALPVIPPCPGQQTPNDQIDFAPGQTAYFGAYYRDLLNTQTTDYAIYDAANEVVDQWSYNTTQAYYASVGLIWDEVLPTGRPPGWWRFDVTYQGSTYSHRFFVGNCLPRPANLVSWWPAEGSANDVKAINHGNLANGAVCAPGYVGQAFSFNGSSYVGLSNTASLGFTTQFTIEGWIKPNAVSAVQQIFSKWSFNPGDFSYQMGLYPTGALRVDLSGTGSSYELIKSPYNVVPAGTWTHVAATYNAGAVRLYVNGVLTESGQSSITSLYQGNTGPTIGVQNGGVQYFNGLVDELAVYDRALTATEIQAIYETGASGTCKCTDADGDGYGANGDVSCPNGTLVDCNDANASVHPGAIEICDGLDNDCNGHVDDNLLCDAASGLTGTSDGSVAWGDYDGDGDLDLLVTGADPSGTSVIRLYRNDGGPHPTFTSVATSLPNLVVGSIRWGDYDRDGDLDLLITGSTFVGPGYSFVSRIYRNSGGPAPTFADIGAGLTPLSNYSEGEWGDYDGDGDLDVLLTGWDASQTRMTKLYRNNGGANPTFTGVVGAFPFGVTKGVIAWGDYDNDGDLDVLLSGDGPFVPARHTRLYRNSGGANPTFSEVSAGLLDYGDATAAWGDYDNDGDLDLVIAGLRGTPTTTIYRNSGGANPTFTDIGAGIVGVRGGSVAWGDCDNDGDLDLVITGDGGAGGLAKVYLNQGGPNPTFVDAGVSLTGVTFSSAAWGDYDNDGDLDLLIAGRPGVQATAMTTLYRNSAANANTAPAAALGLSVTRLGLTKAEFQWGAASDAQTPAGGLSYNLRIGTTPGGNEICGPMSDGASGYRRLPALGNASQRLSSVVTLPAVATYYWSVQAVDGAFAGSPFAAEQVLDLTNVGVEDGGEQPSRFALGPGLPNPFSHSTSLSFDLPRSERVRLDVFDLNGRRVRNLVSRDVEAGRNEARWDGTDERGNRVAAGVYTYRLVAGPFSATRRIVLLP